jgi:fused signal recognition particle receptor
MYKDPEGIDLDVLAAETETAIRALGQLGDEAGLARAWMVLSDLHWSRGRLRETSDAATQAAEHARRTGNRREVGWALGQNALCAIHGPMPVAEGLSWLERLRGGFTKTAARLGDNIAGLASTAALDTATLDDIEEALIASDLGPEASRRIREAIASRRFEQLDERGLRTILAEEIEKILAPVARPLEIWGFPRPHVVLVIGVNGSGKTTTIGKLGHWLQEQDYGVLLAAGDTFRAAAIEQLQIWGQRIGAPVIAGKEGGDAAGTVFDGVRQPTQTGIDVLVVDTAGRLQNKTHLMDELSKIRRVLGRINPEPPHDVLLVLDATTGQNALAQVEVFRDSAGVTGLIMTKLDGTARGGILVAAAEKFGLPIHAIGVGEGADDLRPFDPRAVARAIAGLAPE